MDVFDNLSQPQYVVGRAGGFYTLKLFIEHIESIPDSIPDPQSPQDIGGSNLDMGLASDNSPSEMST